MKTKTTKTENKRVTATAITHYTKH